VAVGTHEDAADPPVRAVGHDGLFLGHAPGPAVPLETYPAQMSPAQRAEEQLPCQGTYRPV
jgi:hypothetical protein